MLAHAIHQGYHPQLCSPSHHHHPDNRHHYQGHRKLVCAFANPLEIDNHNKTEAGAIMEGKYWKRKMATILAEYKKWRYLMNVMSQLVIDDLPYFLLYGCLIQ